MSPSTTPAVLRAAAEGDVERLTEERQRAVRLLLAHPLVTDADPDPAAFALVRRHEGWLKGWFRDQLGYRLVVDTELARLHKRPLPPAPGAPDASVRPLLTHSGAEFDPRRYTLLCLVLAALERMDVQTVLSALAAEVQVLAAAEDDVDPLDLDRHAERQAFVDAVRFLVELRLLRRVDGSEGAFVAGTGDALYDVASRHLPQLLATPSPPSLAADPDELGAEIYPDTDEGQNLRTRHRLMRRLIEEPALYLDELDDAERAYLTSQRHYLLGQATTAVGLPIEVRREGLALIDDTGRFSDLLFPSTGTVAHAALLLAEHLADRAAEHRDGGAAGDAEEGSPAVASAELRSLVGELLEKYGKFWSKLYREDAAGADRLLDDALDRLEKMRLVVRRREGVEPRPAIARYRVES